MPHFDYDLFVIGAGSGGVRASRLAGAGGARVAIAEELRVGGTCVLRGCVPKKLLVMASHFAEELEDARGFGWTVGPSSHDWPALISAKDRELDRLHGIYLTLLKNAGVTLFEQRAHMADHHTVAVGGRTVTAERILIATGGYPVMPAIPGIEFAITSNEALSLPALPDRLAIVGSGYIAVEFAGLFAALGVEVHLIFRAESVLRGFDDDVRQSLTTELGKKGIELLAECAVTAISRESDGHLDLRLSNRDAGLQVDAVLYATGRKPNTRDLGLEALGVALDEDGAVIVDARAESSVSHIYAIGDVTNRITLTPVAIAEAGMLIDRLFRGGSAIMGYDDVPSAVFSQPPVAVVGLSEQAARHRYGAVDVYISRFRPMRHTLSGRDERTLMKLVVKADDQRVVGCHMVGADAPEIIQGLAIALKCGATKADFDATVGIHPTAAEEFVTMREKRPDLQNEQDVRGLI